MQPLPTTPQERAKNNVGGKIVGKSQRNAVQVEDEGGASPANLANSERVA